MTTANEQTSFLSDLNHGPTAILAAATAAASFDAERVQDTYKRFQDHRESVRAGLIERLAELKSHLDAAIDAVEDELKIPSTHPASQRIYKPSGPVGYIGEDETGTR